VEKPPPQEGECVCDGRDADIVGMIAPALPARRLQSIDLSGRKMPVGLDQLLHEFGLQHDRMIMLKSLNELLPADRAAVDAGLQSVHPPNGAVLVLDKRVAEI